MITAPAPSRKSVAWKTLFGTAGVDLSESWWIDGESWSIIEKVARKSTYQRENAPFIQRASLGAL
jgi:hypothetical protein